VGDLTQLGVQLANASRELEGAFRVDKWNGDVNNADKIRSITTLVFVSVLAALAVFLLLAILCGSHGLTRCFAPAVLLAFFLCWVLGSAGISVSVGVADFCVDPDDFIVAQLNDFDATYYIRCDDLHNFPYQKYFDNAAQALYNAQGPAQQLSKYGPFNESVAELGFEVWWLNASLQCQGGLHENYESAVHAVCATGLQAVVETTAGVLAVGLLLLIVSSVLGPVIDSFDPDLNYYYSPLNERYSERSGLVDRRNPYGSYGTKV